MAYTRRCPVVYAAQHTQVARRRRQAENPRSEAESPRRLAPGAIAPAAQIDVFLVVKIYGSSNGRLSTNRTVHRMEEEKRR